jgi:hypothetical protein
MSTPTFIHDCDNCEYLGHWFGCDVYYHDDEHAMKRNVVARYGNEGSEYHSMCEAVLRPNIEQNVEWNTPAGIMPYVNFVMSSNNADTLKASLVGWAMVGLRARPPVEVG